MDTNDLHPEASQRRDASVLARQVETNDTKWLMSSKQGRRIVRRWLASAGIYQTSFTGNSETFFREGKRALGLEILADVTKHAPEDYIAMLTEGTK
jgi:hypothetical protein